MSVNFCYLFPHKYPAPRKPHRQHRNFIVGVCKENIEYNIALITGNVENHTEYKLVEDETLSSTTVLKAEGGGPLWLMLRLLLPFCFLLKSMC
ncbi:hypothetical protein Leryth_016548 [Lithospermum erythrorhizon]|nr:hypothetical protein Leryth_016548 [Lithospermum erythrorhizon]